MRCLFPLLSAAVSQDLVSYRHCDVYRRGKNDGQIFKWKLVLAFCVAYGAKPSAFLWLRE